MTSKMYAPHISKNGKQELSSVTENLVEDLGTKKKNISQFDLNWETNIQKEIQNQLKSLKIFLKSWLAKWSAQGLELEYENKSVTIKKTPQIAEIHRLSCLYELLLPWILTLTSCSNSLPCRSTFLTVKIYPETSHFFFTSKLWPKHPAALLVVCLIPKVPPGFHCFLRMPYI